VNTSTASTVDARKSAMIAKLLAPNGEIHISLLKVSAASETAESQIVFLTYDIGARRANMTVIHQPPD